MSIRERVLSELKTAMKSKNVNSINTLRLILASLKDKDIIARGNGNLSGINEIEITSLLQTMIKQRHDSIELYKKGKREDLVKKEENEISIILEFLPKQLNEKEVELAVLDSIKLTEANSIKDMGKVINLMKQKYNGKMDFRIVSKVVKEKLL
ncbi:GatB/YqeY domain-containing protein [Alphaproteobacteria bacterium]|nr:GatB/YqeY domain-containing protein [Alphaproteobacteria bacterium]